METTFLERCNVWRGELAEVMGSEAITENRLQMALASPVPQFGAANPD